MNRQDVRRHAGRVYRALLRARDRFPLRRWWIRRVYFWAWDGMRHDEFTHPFLQMGARSYGVKHETVQFPTGREQLSVGKYCSIAEGVRVIFGEHSVSRVSTFPLKTVLAPNGTNQDASEKGPVIIGNDVWVGTNALIMSGVTLGHGCVVAAGGVVTKDVPPYAIVGGIPARIIKYRFTPTQIERLLALAWWDWPETELLAHLDDFYEDMDTFLARHTANLDARLQQQAAD